MHPGAREASVGDVPLARCRGAAEIADCPQIGNMLKRLTSR